MLFSRTHVHTRTVVYVHVHVHSVVDPDPAKNERADFISQFRPVNSGLCVL